MNFGKALTLAEAIVTIAVIGIIAVIAIPLLKANSPDKDALAFRKAFYNVVLSFDKATQAIDLNCGSDWKKCRDISPCTLVVSYMNTIGDINCEDESSYEFPNFKTADGIIYWGFENGFDGDTKTIYVDRKLTAREQSISSLQKERGDIYLTTGLRIVLTSDGGVFVPNTSDFAYENAIMEKPLKTVK